MLCMNYTPHEGYVMGARLVWNLSHHEKQYLYCLFLYKPHLEAVYTDRPVHVDLLKKYN